MDIRIGTGSVLRLLPDDHRGRVGRSAAAAGLGGRRAARMGLRKSPGMGGRSDLSRRGVSVVRHDDHLSFLHISLGLRP